MCCCLLSLQLEVDDKDSDELKAYQPQLEVMQLKLAQGEKSLANAQTGDDFSTVKEQLADHQVRNQTVTIHMN